MGINRQAALQVALGPGCVAGLEFRDAQQQLAIGIIWTHRCQLASDGFGLLRQIGFDQSKGHNVLVVRIIRLNGIQPPCHRDCRGAMTGFQ